MMYFDRRNGKEICLALNGQLFVKDNEKTSRLYDKLEDVWKAIDTNTIEWDNEN